MEKQMKAERERRAVILEAEGNKRAAILHAEGQKQAQIERAVGEAEAKMTIAKAEAEAINVVKAALPGKDPAAYMIATKYIKALPEMMKDKNGKLILVPYEATGVMGSIASIKELFTKGS
jgi:regulator of protease activity HflC (stomatin/prohibitin superfamily)